jgi:hypothetical protein
MKTLSAATMSLMITGTQAMASTGGAHTEGMGLLATFFIGFGVLVILFQFIPGIILFVGILKGIFSSETKKSEKHAAENGPTSH